MNLKAALNRNFTHELADVFPIRSLRFLFLNIHRGSLDQVISGPYFRL